MKLIVNNKKKHIEQIQSATHQFQERCGTFFNEKRRQQKKTKQDIANFLNVPIEVVHSYESGKEGIPLFHVHALSEFLNIPQEEIMELYLNLETKFLPKAIFDQDIVHMNRKAGELVRKARKTVFLTQKALAQLLTRSGYAITEKEIKSIEKNSKNATIDFLVAFCKLIHLNIDSISGYSRFEHLSQVNDAFQRNELRFPISSKLLNALEGYRHAWEVNDYKMSFLLQFSLPIRR